MATTRGKSTGPKSPEGKEHSSQNSTSHGMRSNVVRLLPGESQEEKDAARAMWYSQYRAYIDGNEGFISLLNTLVDADWQQKRGMRLTSEAVVKLVEAEAAEDEELGAKLEKKLVLWTRYQTSAENSFQRALRAVEQFLARRRRESMQQQQIILRMRALAHGMASHQPRDGRIAQAEDQAEDQVENQAEKTDGGGGEKRT